MNISTPPQHFFEKNKTRNTTTKMKNQVYDQVKSRFSVSFIFLATACVSQWQ
jgi:hypothetical protein